MVSKKFMNMVLHRVLHLLSSNTVLVMLTRQLLSQLLILETIRLVWKMLSTHIPHSQALMN